MTLVPPSFACSVSLTLVTIINHLFFKASFLQMNSGSLILNNSEIINSLDHIQGSMGA